MAFDFLRDPSDAPHEIATGRPRMRDVVHKESKPEGPAPKLPHTEEKSGADVPIRVVKPLDFERMPREPFFEKREVERVTPPAASYYGFYWFFGVLALAGGGFLLLNIFSYVNVNVTPKQQAVDVNLPIRASATGGRDVGLEVIRLEERGTFGSAVTEVRNVNEKASGQVVIYNAYSQEPQTLVVGTRLEAPNGKIYRLSNAVKVPGTKVEGGKITPQGVEVTAVADKPGPEYNAALTDFTIPGFKGTPRYQKFYARSKTEMKGGASGTFNAVSEEDVQKAIESAKEYFARVFQEKIKANLPEGVLQPENSSRITYTAERVDPPINSEAKEVKVEVLAVFEGFGLNRKDLEETIVSSHLSLAPDETVTIQNLSALKFEKVNEDFPNKVANFRVTGKARFVWDFDEKALKEELIKSKERAKVFEQYPAIERAEIHFKPPWWRIFPKDPDRVNMRRTMAES